MKKNNIILSVFTLIVLFCTQSVSAANLGDVAQTMEESLTPVMDMLRGFGYLGGVMMVMLAIFDFHKVATGEMAESPEIESSNPSWQIREVGSDKVVTEYSSEKESDSVVAISLAGPVCKLMFGAMLIGIPSVLDVLLNIV